MGDRSAYMTPSVDLEDGEVVRHSFAPDRGTYIRDHAWMAALAMGLGMAILWALGNPHVWTGAVGGLLAIVIRAWYLLDEALAERWDLTDRRLLGPGGRAIRLEDIKELRSLGSAVQIVTLGGDKHLMKYQSDRDATKARIDEARP